MSRKPDLNDILHSADDQTIEQIAFDNKSLDEKSSRWIYERCVERMKLNYTDTLYSETIGMNSIRNYRKLKICAITALCAAIFCITLYCLSGLRPEGPEPDKEPPVFFTETAVTTTVTFDITTDTAAVSKTNVSTTGKGNKKGTTTVSAANVTVTANDAVITEKTTSSMKSDNSGTSDQNNTGFAMEDNRTANEQAADRHRPDIDRIADAAVECRSYKELADRIRSEFGKADSVSDAISEYWFNDEGTDKIIVDDSEKTVTRDNGTVSYYILGDPNIEGYEKAALKSNLINRGILYVDEGKPEEYSDSYTLSDISDMGVDYNCAMIKNQSDIDLLNRFNGTLCPRLEMMLSGKIPSSSPKLTYSEASELLDKCNTQDELIEELLKRQYYPDTARQTESDDGYEKDIIFELNFNKEDFQDIHSLKLFISDSEYNGFYDVVAYISSGFPPKNRVIEDNLLYCSEPIDTDLLNRITDGAIK